MPELGRASFGGEIGKVNNGGGALLSDLLTAGTGVTLTGSSEPYTLNVNLSTGVAGGQSVIGGTAASDSLTVSSTSNGTKGTIIFGSTSGFVVDEANAQLKLGTGASAIASSAFSMFTAAANTFKSVQVSNTNAGGSAQCGYTMSQGVALSGATAHFLLTGSGFTTSGNMTAGTVYYQLAGGSGNMVWRHFQNNGDIIFQNQTTDVERFRILNAGSVRHLNAPSISFSSGAAITPAGATVAEWGMTPPNVASAAGAVLDAHKWDATTITLTGATNVTTATGFNFISHEQPTISAGSALTVSAAANVVIKGGPIGGGAGPATLSASYGLWVQAPAITNVSLGGSSSIRCDDKILITATNDPAGSYVRMTGGGSQNISGDGTVQLMGATSCGIYGGGVEGFRVDSNGNAICAAETVIANAATNGFVYLRTVAGAPTGVPTAITGHAATLFDTTNSKLWVYNGSWKGVVVT